MFILLTFSSQLASQKRRARAALGAAVSTDPPPLDSAFAANLTALPEVAGVTRVLSIPASPPYYYGNVYALDPVTFFAVTNPEPWYFRGVGPEVARQVLATPGRVLVTETYLQNAFLAVGDRLRFEAPAYNGSNYTGTTVVNTTIGGTVRGLPGTGNYGFSMPSAIYGSAETFGPLLAAQPSPSGPPLPRYGGQPFLPAPPPGADWRAPQAVIISLGAFRVSLPPQQIDRRRSKPRFR